MHGRSGGRGGISDARRYTPRGRTVREAASRDPFRPALELLHGEPAQQRPTREPAQPRTPVKKAPTTTPRRRPSPTAARRAGRSTAPKARPTARRPARKPKRPPRLAEPARRLRLGTLVVLALFTIVAGRLVTLQLTDAQNIALEGLKDRLFTEKIFAPRGAIYDRDHNVLAQSVEARYVYADPSQIDAKDVAATADRLRAVLGIPTSELTPALSRKTRTDGSKDQFEYLARGVDIDTGNRVKALNLAGIGVGRDEQRIAPGNDLAANLIGFTNDNGDGAFGLEAGYNDQLAGVDGSRTFEVGVGNLSAQIPTGYQEQKPARPGSSLQLTIDRDLQYEVQQMLAKRMSAVNADFGCAVVLDIHTFEVMAQASYPDYNAANPAGSTAAERTDQCSQTVVDPGSIHKVITLGAALETGTINANSTVQLPGSTIRKADVTYVDTHPLPPGTKITIPGILAWSSNVGTITVASQLQPQTLYDYQLKFGLGKATGEGMPQEASGLVQPPANWSGSSYGSIPIGMGVSVTPLQMAAVYATIANGGVYVRPRLVKAVTSPDGTVHPTAEPQTWRALSAANAATLRQDLEAVVTAEGATAHSAALPAYRVAGKTGTGAMVKDGKYVPGDVASFIGMAPADNPQYVIAVFGHSPHGEGGAVAGPAFKDMMSATLMHFAVPPTGTKPPTFALTQ
jgi:cell division protein FtsI (penicillin-binding protein 3)